MAENLAGIKSLGCGQILQDVDNIGSKHQTF
jgi:hypothetical protein